MVLPRREPHLDGLPPKAAAAAALAADPAAAAATALPAGCALEASGLGCASPSAGGA